MNGKFRHMCPWKYVIPVTTGVALNATPVKKVDNQSDYKKTEIRFIIQNLPSFIPSRVPDNHYKKSMAYFLLLSLEIHFKGRR